ncbi:hypothetical protein P3T18_004035 [Paraburkholderia sp. GAS199]
MKAGIKLSDSLLAFNLFAEASVQQDFVRGRVR